MYVRVERRERVDGVRDRECVNGQERFLKSRKKGGRGDNSRKGNLIRFPYNVTVHTYQMLNSCRSIVPLPSLSSCCIARVKDALEER